MAYRLGVDVGGTFTDFLSAGRGERPDTFTAKVPSTPEDSSIGVLSGVAAHLRRVGRRAVAGYQARDARHDRRHQCRPHRQGRASSAW